MSAPAVPPGLQWLDDAARALYETMHRYSHADGGVPNVPWGWDWSGTDHAPGRRPWEHVARSAAAERGEPEDDLVSTRPLSALAEEAARLAGGAS